MDESDVGPRGPDAALTKIHYVIDAVGIHAVLALNQAHSLLADARVTTGPPPSDKWYRLLEELEDGLVRADQLTTVGVDPGHSPFRSDDERTSVGSRACRMLVLAA